MSLQGRFIVQSCANLHSELARKKYGAEICTHPVLIRSSVHSKEKLRCRRRGIKLKLVNTKQFFFFGVIVVRFRLVGCLSDFDGLAEVVPWRISQCWVSGKIWGCPEVAKQAKSPQHTRGDGQGQLDKSRTPELHRVSLHLPVKSEHFVKYWAYAVKLHSKREEGVKKLNKKHPT